MELKKQKLVTPFAAAILASIANLGFIAFTRRTAEISTNFEPLTYGPVILATFVAAFAGFGIYELLKKYKGQAKRYFLYTGGFVLVFSFMPIGHGALSMENAGMAEINVLGVTHVLAFLIVTAVLFESDLR